MKVTVEDDNGKVSVFEGTNALVSVCTKKEELLGENYVFFSGTYFELCRQFTGLGRAINEEFEIRLKKENKNKKGEIK